MKKNLLFLAVFFTATIFAKAQTNIQVMYDFGKDRQNVTTTLEMFKGDNWGSTFFFVDITHDGKFQHKAAVILSQKLILGDADLGIGIRQ